MTKNTSQDEEQPLHRKNSVPLITPLITWRAKQRKKYEALNAQYPEDAANIKKAEIALYAGLFVGPCLYLGIAPAVFYYPEITTWLGLDAFAQYLMQQYSENYENLAQTKNTEFADNFSRLHAVSLLMALVFFIPALIGTETYCRMLSTEYKNKMFSIASTSANDNRFSRSVNRALWTSLGRRLVALSVCVLIAIMLEIYYDEFLYDGFLIVFAVILFAFCVGIFFGIQTYYKRKPKSKTQTKHKGWFWACAFMLISGSYLLWHLPEVATREATHKGFYSAFSASFTIKNGGLGTVVVLLSAGMFLVSASIIVIYIAIREHYWHKFKSRLTGNRN